MSDEARKRAEEIAAKCSGWMETYSCPHDKLVSAIADAIEKAETEAYNRGSDDTDKVLTLQINELVAKIATQQTEIDRLKAELSTLTVERDNWQASVKELAQACKDAITDRDALKAELKRRVEFSEQWMANPNKTKPESFEEWGKWMEGWNELKRCNIKNEQEITKLKAELERVTKDAEESVRQKWRKQIHEKWGGRNAEGKCVCAYCRRDLEQVFEHAGCMEMDLFCAESERDALKLKLEAMTKLVRVHIAAFNWPESLTPELCAKCSREASAILAAQKGQQ